MWGLQYIWISLYSTIEYDFCMMKMAVLDNQSLGDRKYGRYR